MSVQQASQIVKLIGKVVEVILDHDGPVVAKGRLLSYDEYGEVVLQDEDGHLRWSWPALHVREVES